jgi:2-polyprenyl-3-methyl-5-hydroxy-6-metoxy-1,4-benzoquinol methylase
METAPVRRGHDERQQAAYIENADHILATVEGRDRTYARKARIAACRIEDAALAGHRILEIGCGGGFFTRELALRLPRASIVATDTFEPMLDACRQRVGGLPNVSVRRMDGQGSLAGEHPFDVVCAVDVIHHLANPPDAMRAWRAQAQPGGLLIAMEANPLHPVLALKAMSKPEERRFFLNNPDRLRRWTEQAGWMEVTIERLPLYLPAGPGALAGTLDRLEDLLHRGRGIWGFLSGGFLISAKA